MITGLSHVSLIVPDLEAAAERLGRVYGLTLGEVYSNPQQGVRLAYVELGNARIELMQPLPGNASLRRFLERHPQGGLHHVALTVDSMAQTCEALATSDVRAVSAPEARNVHGDPIAFIHPRDFLGVLLELEASASAPGPLVPPGANTSR